MHEGKLKCHNVFGGVHLEKALQKIEANLLSLPSSSRVYLLEKLCESLENEPLPEVEAAWAKEIEHRIGTLDSGQVSPMPAAEVFQSLIQKLNEARRISS